MKQLNSGGTDWRQQRRKQALLLKQQGWPQRQIADALGVSEAAVSQWMCLAQDGVKEPWRGTPHLGRVPKLRPEQLRLLPDLLSHGAEAYGFFGEVWTCARIAQVIRDEFGIDHHRAHVSRLLKQLGWTPQLPIERAAQRNESEIAGWRNELWPELKKRRQRIAPRSCLWTNPASTCCPVGCGPMLRVGRRPCCATQRRAITSR